MYIIKRNGKHINTKKYSSYDEARNYARKVIRKSTLRHFSGSFYDISDLVYNNPSLRYYGFSVVKV